MRPSVRPGFLWSFLTLASMHLACGGSDGSSGDGDGSGDGGTSGDGDGDGDVVGDGDSGGTTGDGHADSGGSAGGVAGSGGSGGNSASGLCHDEMCGGNCVPTTDAPLSCESEWSCLNVLTCLRDIASYCGCDGKTFEASSNCAPFAFAHRGACEEGALGTLNCDASQVVTDDLPPDCDFGYLPQVIGGTWGDCVPISDCGCETSGRHDQCGPDYVCYTAGYCGHLLTKSLP